MIDVDQGAQVEIGIEGIRSEPIRVADRSRAGIRIAGGSGSLVSTAGRVAVALEHLLTTAAREATGADRRGTTVITDAGHGLRRTENTTRGDQTTVVVDRVVPWIVDPIAVAVVDGEVVAPRRHTDFLHIQEKRAVVRTAGGHDQAGRLIHNLPGRFVRPVVGNDLYRDRALGAATGVRIA